MHGSKNENSYFEIIKALVIHGAIMEEKDIFVLFISQFVYLYFQTGVLLIFFEFY